MDEITLETYYRVDQFGHYLAGPFGSCAEAAANPGDVAWRVVLVPLCGTPVTE